MKIETTPREDHQMSMLVEVDADQFQGAKRRAARKIAEKGKIPGFRPGKAPYDVILRYYGESAIAEEAVEILVNDIYPEALKQANIEPAAPGSLENIESFDPPVFKFTVPLTPTVELGDYRSVRKAYEFQSPDDAKVEESLDELRRMYGTTETVERGIEEGDFAMVGVKAFVKDEAIEEYSRDSFPLFIRPEERDDEWPYTGFAKNLIGSKPGESKKIAHKFPKDFPDENVAGKTINFEVEVRTVRGVTLPELNDEFAQTLGAENLEELRSRLRENVESHERSEYDDNYFIEVFDLIKTGATIKYPPQVLEHEEEHVLEDLKRRLADQNMDIETYFKMRDTTEEKFVEEEARPVAQKRLERSLLIEEIYRQEKLEVDATKLEEEFEQTWANLSATDEKFAKLTKGGTRASKELIDAVASDTAQRMMVTSVLDRIKAIATGQAPELPVDTEKAPSTEEKPKKKAAKKASKSGE